MNDPESQPTPPAPPPAKKKPGPKPGFKRPTPVLGPPKPPAPAAKSPIDTRAAIPDLWWNSLLMIDKELVMRVFLSRMDAKGE